MNSETCEICGKRINLFDAIIWNRHDKCSEKIIENLINEDRIKRGIKNE